MFVRTQNIYIRKWSRENPFTKYENDFYIVSENRRRKTRSV